MPHKSIAFAAAITCAAIVVNRTAHADAMTLLTHINANQFGGFSAGEIVSFDPNTNRLFVTSSGNGVHRINAFDASNPAAPTPVGTVDFSSIFGTPADALSLSSVKVDPLGRFGVASIIPTQNTTTLGKVGFFDLNTGAILGTTNVGYHPDSVTISSDGSKLIVVNEGEYNAASATNAPGSLSVIDVSGIVAGSPLPALSVTTTDFSAPNLAAGVSLSGIRQTNLAAVGTSGTFIANVPDFTDPANQDPNAIEPEFATISGNKVFVSLQENNAIGEYDLSTNKWTKISNLGTITQLIDASDQDGGININDSVKGMPMPDTLASYTIGGKTYVVTANEGDARPDDRDISRFGDIGGNDSMNNILDLGIFPNTQTGIRANDVLGRLNVSRLDGDTDGDGKIEEPVMLGTRSMSIWEQTAGGLVLAGDTGSLFEEYLRDLDPSGWAENRNDDKGPEPEGLVLGEVDGVTYAFVGMERTAGIFMLDISDPTSPVFVDYLRIDAGAETPLRPEGFDFVPAHLSPTGVALLIVGFEGDGDSVSSERIAMISVIPEPATLGLLGLGGLVLGRRRRA